MITFRELTDESGDLAALRAFYDTLYVTEFPDPDERESLANMADYLRRKHRGWYGRNSYHIVLGLADGAVVAASISDYLAEPNTGVIEFLLIAPACRGTGAGRKLLAHTESLLDEDARRAHDRPLDAILAEMNDPLATSARTDNLDPVTRALIWHRWGYRGLDFPYVQPALSPDQDPVTNLILIGKPLRADWSAAIPAPIVASTVHEYLRWAMRIDEPDASPEFRDMATALGRTDGVAQLPLDRYVGRDDTFDLRPATDADEFAAAMTLYRNTFAPGPATVPESAFRRARADPDHRLWTLRRTPADPAPAGLASFFALPAAGFAGYLALTGPLRHAGLLRRLVARMETELLSQRHHLRGWYAELAPDTDAAPFRHLGCHELAVDYHQPAPDLPIRLLFKAPGRVYAPPALTTADLLADIEDVLTSVYAVADPRTHPTLRRLRDALPDSPEALVPLR
ncbi:GNAT family N-acetyltransferase [Nocardia sp. BMG111209]|uniref:GNAT family N-acetyltransferase n=1 Tax=Nocardia sp. BMG111209 TaxID=1160137 RepID=UPI000370C639|nr:GNAT family N-acetyltransferase [Nocardia sp. BMG111209]